VRVTIVLGPFQRLPPAGFGAVEKVWLELARNFSRNGHDVCVIGRGGGRKRDYVEECGLRVIEVRGLTATGHIALDLCKDLLYSFRVIPAIPRADIVVTNSFWLPAVLAPIKRLKGKIIVHVARYPKGQMWLYLGADAIQTISSAVARAIARQCGAIKGKIAVVGYPVDTDVFSPPAGDRRLRKNPVILYVGRVHPEKGVHLLIDAFRSIVDRAPAARLRIVGPASELQGGGGQGYLQLLRTAAAGLPVEFVEAISDDRVLSRMYQEADCFCYPSLAEKGEAFGRAVLEAMATGLPCVVSKLECFADFLEDGAEGMVFDHRGGAPAAALGDAVCSILLDPERAIVLGARARSRAEQHSVDRIAGAYLALFERVANSKPVAQA
jgi:glycosyltransferase involved in cell wall biosynthesis